MIDACTDPPCALAAEALPPELGVPALWASVAAAVQGFIAEQGVSAADTVVLLPFAQLLPLARAAWAELQPSGWMPRFETTLTLAESLAPVLPPAPDGPGGDLTTDRLQAARMLADRAPDWPRRDPRSFDLAVRRLVDLTHALTAARAATPPPGRPAWLAAARERLAGPPGPAANERALARLALEWSLDASTEAADALFSHRPGAWLGVRAGARDPLAEALLAAAQTPTLWLETDRDPAALPLGEVEIAACRDFEDEAQRAAAAVFEHLRRLVPGSEPVALVALDRILVRRVSALLVRQGLPLTDETGWKLSTTRAGARVIGLLRATSPRASTDELLDLLKSLPAGGALSEAAVDALEADLRRGGRTELAQVDPLRLPPAALTAWGFWTTASEPLRAGGKASLAQWLLRLADALQRCGLQDALAADAAGSQVLAALRCPSAPGASHGIDRQAVAFAAAARRTDFTATAFQAWVDGVLEQASFRPAADPQARVVITPLARVLLRPFGAVVCPGADAAHLGAAAAPEPLLGDALGSAVGLPGVAAQREAERQAFAQLARVPRLTLLHRLAEGAEPMSASPLMLRWQLAAARAGRPLPAAGDPRPLRSFPVRPTQRPLPTAPALVPDRYSASRYEALRTCPYRFYAGSMLRLGEAEELDDELEKGEVGTWLHAVLQRFHAERPVTRGKPEADLACLQAVAAEEAGRRFGGGPSAADFLPFEAWFEAIAPAYVGWLQQVESAGWALQASEFELHAPVVLEDGLGGPLVIDGRLDRVDRRHVGAGSSGHLLEPGEHLRLIDYKFKARAALQAQVRIPLEDTQVAFYAALLAAARGGWPDGGIEAGYLAFDGREELAWVEHPGVAESAQSLLEGLANDVMRLRTGAALPALGDGVACDYCSARGLCRRDHWEAA